MTPGWRCSRQSESRSPTLSRQQVMSKVMGLYCVVSCHLPQTQEVHTHVSPGL